MDRFPEPRFSFRVETSAQEIHVSTNATCRRIKRSRFQKIWVAGRLFGAVCDGTALNREEVVDRLSDCADIENVVQIVKMGLGSFYIIIQHSGVLHIVSSSSSCGVFFAASSPGLTLSDNELALFSDQPFPRLNETEALRFVLDVWNLSPHQGFLEGVRRVPGASLLTVQLPNTISMTSFINPEAPLQRLTSTEFTKLIDACAKVLVDDLRANGEVPVVYLSGGVDSLVLLLALAKNGADVVAIHGAEAKTPEFNIALCKKILEALPANIRPRLIVSYPGNSAKLSDRLTRVMLGSLVKSNYSKIDWRLKLADVARIETFQNDSRKPVVFSGWGIDGLYTFRKGGTQLTSISSGKIFYRLAAIRQYSRYLNPVLKLTSFLSYLSGRDLRKKNDISLRFFKSHVLGPDYRSADSLPSPELHGLYAEHAKERHDAIMALIGPNSGFFSHESHRSELSLILKLAIYYHNDSVHTLRFRDYGFHDGTRFELPFLYGPILCSLVRHPLRLADSFKPKDLLHHYVAGVLGARYRSFVQFVEKSTTNETLVDWIFSRPAFFFRKIRRKLSTTKHMKNPYYEYLGTLYNDHKSAWNGFADIRNEPIRSFFCELEAQLLSGSVRPKNRIDVANFVHLTIWVHRHLAPRSGRR